jgi:hypothetical protein
MALDMCHPGYSCVDPTNNDVQKSSAISIKNFNEIMDDVKSATSPALIEVEEDEEVSVSSLVSPHYLSFFRLLF